MCSALSDAGLDKAMGMKSSKVGCSRSSRRHGFTLGNLMIWWMNAYDYAIPIGGQTDVQSVQRLPPSYELTILLGSFGALLGMLFLNRLPRLHHPC